jgi:hypothetical protein
MISPLIVQCAVTDLARFIHSYNVYGPVVLSYVFPIVRGSASQVERVSVDDVSTPPTLIQ